MKKIALLIASILTVACTQEPLRVMSYNIRLGIAEDGDNAWANRKVATPAMLEDIRPCVFGVQEAHDFQIAYILEHCPQYKAVGVGREDGISEGEHMSVFYDTTRVALLDWGAYWLSETPDVPSFGWDAWCKRTATWTLLKDIDSGKKFFFVNTHLDHRGVVARKEGLAMIHARIQKMNPDGLPMVLTGDFNVRPDNDGLADLNTLMKSARFTATKADTIGSFNGFGRLDENGKPISLPIDYIYYSGFKECLTFNVDTITYAGKPYISDHYPIFADLEF